MKIAILSDTHNHQGNIQKAVSLIHKIEPAGLIFCGDANTLESIQWFCEYPLIYTYGNCDELTGEIKSFLMALKNNSYAGNFYEGKLIGKMIGVTHGHLAGVLDDMGNSSKFDYIFTGHTHLRMDNRVGNTRVINPGALGGLQKESRSFAILDLDKDVLQFIMIDE